MVESIAGHAVCKMMCVGSVNSVRQVVGENGWSVVGAMLVANVICGMWVRCDGEECCWKLGHCLGSGRITVCWKCC